MFSLPLGIEPMRIQQETFSMDSDECRDLFLASLVDGSIPGVSRSRGAAFAEAAAVCLDECMHPNGVEMGVTGDLTARYRVHWPELDEHAHSAWADDTEAAEHGAYGIAVLVVTDRTDLAVIRRSLKGTGFDYWLGSPSDPDFQNKGRLEASGKRRSAKGLDGRATQKANQMDRSNRDLPGYAVVVDFVTPVTKVVRR